MSIVKRSGPGGAVVVSSTMLECPSCGHRDVGDERPCPECGVIMSTIHKTQVVDKETSSENPK